MDRKRPRGGLFDSADPTGDHGDLVTPGDGPGNLTAEQQVLIIPTGVNPAVSS